MILYAVGRFVLRVAVIRKFVGIIHINKVSTHTAVHKNPANCTRII